MAGESHTDRTRSVLQSFSGGDLDALMGQLTDDVLWHVGGDHPLSGDYRGQEEVRGYHQRVAEITGGTLRLEPIDILGSGRFLGIFVRATARASGRDLDATLVEAIRLDGDGRWAEFWALAADQEAVDAFWKEVTT
ncbi:MAG: nuclear transport factor 2 family protein [Actinomycetota bacterium]